MPIPFLLGLVAVGAAAIGVMGHVDASNKNQSAKNISEQAVSLYNESKRKLEKKKKDSEDALYSLGQTKNGILSGSMKRFVDSYGKLQHIKFQKSSVVVNVSDLVVRQEDVLHIQTLTNIYSSAIQDAVLGTTAGALMCLAASGSLVATSTAIGGALVAGEFASAASIAGSSFMGLTAVASTLSLLAAPVALFTGLSASVKADENLSKAKEMLAEAEAASSKMELSASLYNGVIDKSDMLKDLLLRLDDMFSFGVNFTEEAINSHCENGNIIDAKSFTDDELKIIYMTKALAGAVKGVIDTPVLNSNGNVSGEPVNISHKLLPKISSIEKGFNEVADNYLEEANQHYRKAHNALANAQQSVQEEITRFGTLKKEFYCSQILDKYFLFYDEISMAKFSNGEQGKFIDKTGIDALKWLRDCCIYLFSENKVKQSDENIKAAVLGLCGTPKQEFCEILNTWSQCRPKPVAGIEQEELSIALNLVSLGCDLAIVPNPISAIYRVSDSVNRIKVAQDILRKAENIEKGANKAAKYANDMCSKLQHQTELLGSMIYMFEVSNAMLAKCVYKRKGFFGRLFNKTLNRSDFKKDDLELLDFNFELVECIRLISSCPMTYSDGEITAEYKEAISRADSFVLKYAGYFETLEDNEFYSADDGGKLKNHSDKLITASIKKKFLRYEDKKPMSKIQKMWTTYFFCFIIYCVLKLLRTLGWISF